jgi:hypothetical protein
MSDKAFSHSVQYYLIRKRILAAGEELDALHESDIVRQAELIQLLRNLCSQFQRLQFLYSKDE